MANGKIAFTTSRDGNQEIYLMNADGSGQTRLTNNRTPDDFPIFSPDGTMIAFRSQDEKGRWWIKRMKVDGSDVTEITPLAAEPPMSPWHEEFSMSWSPDGRKIAFQEAGDIFTVDIDGSNRTNLTRHPAIDLEPTWSRDGSRIFFVSSRVFYLTLHSMKADGSDVQELPTADEFWDMAPDAARAADKLVFVVRSEMTVPAIYTANVDGTNRQVVERCTDRMCSAHRNQPKWSPDGTKIVFHEWEYFSNDTQIFVKALDGTERVQLTRPPGVSYQPSWQPVPPEPKAD